MPDHDHRLTQDLFPVNKPRSRDHRQTRDLFQVSKVNEMLLLHACEHVPPQEVHEMFIHKEDRMYIIHHANQDQLSHRIRIANK